MLWYVKCTIVLNHHNIGVHQGIALSNGLSINNDQMIWQIIATIMYFMQTTWLIRAAYACVYVTRA